MSQLLAVKALIAQSVAEMIGSSVVRAEARMEVFMAEFEFDDGIFSI